MSRVQRQLDTPRTPQQPLRAGRRAGGRGGARGRRVRVLGASSTYKVPVLRYGTGTSSRVPGTSNTTPTVYYEYIEEEEKTCTCNAPPLR